jgi:2-haloacid dehalogenase
MTPDSRAVAAVANAIDAALDTWDVDRGSKWDKGMTDSHAVADAIIKLLPQFGYRVAAIRSDDRREARGHRMTEPRRPILVFDVNETLLDLSALDVPFEEPFGDRAARREWFQQLLHLAFLTTITGGYRDFSALGRSALHVVAERRGGALTPEQSDAVLESMRSLPPHPEVPHALERLRSAGFRLTALTNNVEGVVRDQMTNAGLLPIFERILSADRVRRLKPAPEPYRMAARELGVPMGDLCLVAAHTWDVVGALSCGCRAAFVARPGMVLDPEAPRPDTVGPNLSTIATSLIARHGDPTVEDRP